MDINIYLFFTLHIYTIFVSFPLTIFASFVFIALFPTSDQIRSVAQSCLTLCDPMDCSLPGFSLQGIFQARVLEWVTISFSRISSQTRD